MPALIDWALFYHNEGLCIIPARPRDKAIAIDWEKYQTRQSTEAEVKSWWRAMPNSNIGSVHGINGYILLDVDHDKGVFAHLCGKFPNLFSGRIELSGSGEGYHIPIIVVELPDLGWDNSKDRPKGNRTYHTPKGDVNVRARWCQTILAPSIHPSGKVYRFHRFAPIVHVLSIHSLLEYLLSLDPQPVQKKQDRSPSNNGHMAQDLHDAYPSILDLFRSLGYTDDTQVERDGRVRILHHGGLLLDMDRGTWYNYSDEIGGDVIDAWGWAKHGKFWNRRDRAMFAIVTREMRVAAGLRKPIGA